MRFASSSLPTTRKSLTDIEMLMLQSGSGNAQLLAVFLSVPGGLIRCGGAVSSSRRASCVIVVAVVIDDHGDIGRKGGRAAGRRMKVALGCGGLCWTVQHDRVGTHFEYFVDVLGLWSLLSVLEMIGWMSSPAPKVQLQHSDNKQMEPWSTGNCILRS